MTNGLDYIHFTVSSTHFNAASIKLALLLAAAFTLPRPANAEKFYLVPKNSSVWSRFSRFHLCCVIVVLCRFNFRHIRCALWSILEFHSFPSFFICLLFASNRIFTQVFFPSLSPSPPLLSLAFKSIKAYWAFIECMTVFVCCLLCIFLVYLLKKI